MAAVAAAEGVERRGPDENTGKVLPTYPDFLVFRDVDGATVVDLLDPYNVDLPDGPAKARRLTQYAKAHGPSYGRIELIIVDGKRVSRLDMIDETTRDRVASVATGQHLRLLFDLP